MLGRNHHLTDSIQYNVELISLAYGANEVQNPGPGHYAKHNAPPLGHQATPIGFSNISIDYGIYFIKQSEYHLNFMRTEGGNKN